VAPTPEERAQLQRAFDLHEVALRDALRVGTPPKLMEFENHLFLVAHTPVERADGRAKRQALGHPTRKIAVFLGSNWLLTIVREELLWLDDLRARAGKDPAYFLASPDHCLLELLDRTCDGFEGMVDALIDVVEELEDRAVEDPRPALLQEIHALRRRQQGILRVTRGQRDLLLAITRSPHPVLSARAAPYFRGVHDHVLRVYELLEGVHDNISGARDAYLAAVNNRLSDTMRALTVIATVMMPMTLLSGVFGMNFERMPLVGLAGGFWIACLMLATVGLLMWAWFKKRMWV
jgi:magnesium transporter